VIHPCETFRSGAPHAYFGAHRLKSPELHCWFIDCTNISWSN